MYCRCVLGKLWRASAFGPNKYKNQKDRAAERFNVAARSYPTLKATQALAQGTTSTFRDFGTLRDFGIISFR